MVSLSQAMKKMVGHKSGRLTKEWNYNSQSSLLVVPAVADVTGNGTLDIVVATSKGELIVLDAQAKEIWRYNIQEKVSETEAMFLDQDVMNSISSAPAIIDLTGTGKNNILFGSEMGLFYCLDEKGKEVWKFKTKGGIRGSPLVADVDGDGKLEVVFGTTENFLYILDAKGKLIESFEQSSPVESTPGYFNGQIIFGTNDGTLVSIKASGEKNWSYKTRDKITAAPAFSRLTSAPVDFLLIGSCDGNLYCLDTDGQLVWIYETEGAIYSKVAIADLNEDGNKEIVFGSCDNNIHAVTHDGERYWTYETDFWVVSEPIIADVDGDGKLEVVAGSYDHNIYVLDSQGSYVLDYVPGLSGVVQQAGHYSEIMTQEPGQQIGKKLWQFKTEGVVIGCAKLGESKGLVIATKVGFVDGIIHTE